jgi:hypothetical protein
MFSTATPFAEIVARRAVRRRRSDRLPSGTRG